MGIGQFRSADSLLLPVPLSTGIALVLTLGCAWLALGAARRASGGRPPSGFHTAAAFIGILAAIAVLVHVMALAAFARIDVLRASAACLGVCACGWLRRDDRRWLADALREAKTALHTTSGIERYVVVSSTVTVGALALASLGPPTDVDSVAYHLSVPLAWLSHGGAYPTPDWLHSRLVGVGEALNMLGLAAGTDVFGSVLQFSGLLVCVIALTSTAVAVHNRVLALALVAGCPLLPFLTLTSKPQLLPAAASGVALAMCIRRIRATPDRLHQPWEPWLFWLCLAFAAACKYSFIPGAMAIGALGVMQARQERRLTHHALVGCVVVLCVAAPVYLRNYWFYADPLSPSLEKLRQRPDPVLTTFTWFLRNFAGDHSWRTLIRAPLSFMVPTDPRQLTTVLGAGALAVLLVWRSREFRPVMVMAGAATAALLLFGQLQARFFIEPYLWLGLCAVASPWSTAKPWLVRAIGVQMLVTTVVAVYAAIVLFPGALTAAQRERTLEAMAPGYSLAQWIDRTVPTDAVVAMDQRSSYFLTRSSVSVDVPAMLNIMSLPLAEHQESLIALLARQRATVVVITEPVSSSPYEPLRPILGEPFAISPAFPDPVRNPWTRQSPSRAMLFAFPAPAAGVRSNAP